jgi:hypothetical protein
MSLTQMEQTNREDEYVYVLCSRYSRACAQFLSKAQALQFVRPIFIDNSSVRKIVSSSPLKIQTVPCVLGSINGYVATYEGRDAFSWLDEMLSYNNSEDTREEISNEFLNQGINPEKINAHVTHKIDAKEAADRMRKEREDDDNRLHNPRLRVKEKEFE